MPVSISLPCVIERLPTLGVTPLRYATIRLVARHPRNPHLIDKPIVPEPGRIGGVKFSHQGLLETCGPPDQVSSGHRKFLRNRENRYIRAQ